MQGVKNCCPPARPPSSTAALFTLASIIKRGYIRPTAARASIERVNRGRRTDTLTNDEDSWEERNQVRGLLTQSRALPTYIV